MRISDFCIAGERIPERDFGIVGEFEPPAYNVMQRYCRDKGWMPIDRIMRLIYGGTALEVGPGPGYLGLEWLKRTQSTVLKPGGKFIIGDLRRDMNPLLKLLIWSMCRPKALRSGWLTSINASYTQFELREILSRTNINDYQIDMDSMRYFIIGEK